VVIWRSNLVQRYLGESDADTRFDDQRQQDTFLDVGRWRYFFIYGAGTRFAEAVAVLFSPVHLPASIRGEVFLWGAERGGPHSMLQISSWRKPTMHPASKPSISSAVGLSTNPCTRPSYHRTFVGLIVMPPYRLRVSA
jgi:hypothetical protein